MTNRKTILIVDDEPDVLKWLSVLFENNGYRAITAEDGFEGFEKAEAEHPDLITLDISMPRESGIKMYRNLHESKELSQIPVIMVTGVSSEFERFISTRKQVNPPAAYFEKPIKERELLEKVRELVA